MITSVRLHSASGKALTIEGWCSVHCRLLGYKETRARACFWCDPSKAPVGHRLHGMTAEQIAADLVYRKQADAELRATRKD